MGTVLPPRTPTEAHPCPHAESLQRQLSYVSDFHPPTTAPTMPCLLFCFPVCTLQDAPERGAPPTPGPLGNSHSLRRCPLPGGGITGGTVLCHARGLVQCVLVLCVARACTPCVSFSCKGGGAVYSLDRLPFGSKYSPIICQFALSEIVTPLIPKEIVRLHYMDDFLLIGPDPAKLPRVMTLVAEALRGHGFIVSPKSTLTPVERIFFPGKWLDLSTRAVSSHPRAFLQMLSAWLRVAVRTLNYSSLVGKLVGFMQWHVRPRLGTGPLFAGSYCWMRWGNHRQGLPLKV